uniref:Uncharacterized protein n=1 Tax=Arundo donax TaxID=35708 RepID=A0A0A9FGK8_ARUDO
MSHDNDLRLHGSTNR